MDNTLLVATCTWQNVFQGKLVDNFMLYLFPWFQLCSISCIIFSISLREFFCINCFTWSLLDIVLKNDVIMCVSLLSHIFRKVDIEWPSFIVINVNSCMPSASFLFFLVVFLFSYLFYCTQSGWRLNSIWWNQTVPFFHNHLISVHIKHYDGYCKWWCKLKIKAFGDGSFLIVCHFICRFWAGVGWNVKDLRHYASRIKHSQMKVCSVFNTLQC